MQMQRKHEFLQCIVCLLINVYRTDYYCVIVALLACKVSSLQFTVCFCVSFNQSSSGFATLCYSQIVILFQPLNFKWVIKMIIPTIVTLHCQVSTFALYLLNTWAISDWVICLVVSNQEVTKVRIGCLRETRLLHCVSAQLLITSSKAISLIGLTNEIGNVGFAIFTATSGTIKQ